MKRQTDRLIQLSRKIKIFLTKGPAYHYTYTRWRLRHWTGPTVIDGLALDNQAFLAQFDLSRADLSSARQTATQQVDTALQGLTGYFRKRASPAFFFQSTDLSSLTTLIDQTTQQQTIAAADEICQNIFNFRQAAPVKFEQQINWTYQPQNNLDWCWDLNRHAYFETLGRAYHYTQDEKYALKFRSLLQDWLLKNPVSSHQPNWTSPFEVGFRINTWLWAFHLFQSSSSFDHETCLVFLKGLLTHGSFLDANIELHVQNNHLLLEAKALAMLGILFPEFQAAARWQARGLQILFKELKAQVCPDGVHGERAVHYHRVISGELLELLVLLENNGQPIPAAIKSIFEQMVEFELWITKPDGQIPLLADSALEDTYLRFSAAGGGPRFLGQPDLLAMAPPLDEATRWLLGAKRIISTTNANEPIAPESRAFPDGGYLVMRHGVGKQAKYLSFDCGPFGYKLVPGHGHADALSFELFANGQTFLVDPGIYSTQLGADWRNFFRGSRAHNTVIVDGQDQSILVDTWRVDRPARATLHQWLTTAEFDFVDGSHDGYQRLSERITHRRQIFFVKPEYWIVVDLLTGSGIHEFDLLFHLAADFQTHFDADTAQLHICGARETKLVVAPLHQTGLEATLISGEVNPIQGWVSRYSGEKFPAPVLCYRQRTSAPAQFCTILYPIAQGQSSKLDVSPLAVDVDQGPMLDEVTAVQIRFDDRVDYLVIDRSVARRRKRFGGYETDAQLVYLQHQPDNQRPDRNIRHGGTYLSFQGCAIEAEPADVRSAVEQSSR